MGLDFIISKMRKHPTYLGTGAGKLAKAWGSTQDEVRLAKRIVRGVSGYNEPAKSGPKILIFDIESAPMVVYAFSRWKQNISLNQTISESFLISWSAKWFMSTETMSDCLTPEEAIKKDDSRIVKSLWKLFDDADVLVAHNALQFDIPKANSRFIIHGLEQPSPYQVIDTLAVAKKYFGFSSNKLDALAGYFDIQTKLDTDFTLWAKCMEGDKESLDYMQKYNLLDSEILEEVYIKLRPWVKAHPNASLYYDDDKQRCCSCGSTNVERVEDKFYYTSVGKYEVYRCGCGALSRGRRTIVSKNKNANTLTSAGK